MSTEIGAVTARGSGLIHFAQLADTLNVKAGNLVGLIGRTSFEHVWNCPILSLRVTPGIPALGSFLER
jgi:hypothetical protein